MQVPLAFVIRACCKTTARKPRLPSVTAARSARLICGRAVLSKSTTRLVLFALVILALRILVAERIPLLREEAFFWEWSQHLDLGYVERPPMVAWVVHGCSWLAPPASQLGVRLGPLLLGIASAGVAYWLAWCLFHDRRAAEWTLLLSLCLPIFNGVGVLTSSEAPLLLFYLLFLLCFWNALQVGRTADWLLAGVAGGLAILSKLEAAVALVAAGGYLAVIPTHRPWLRRGRPYLGLVAMLCVLAPYLYWDYRHGWVSLSFHWWRALQSQTAVGPSQLVEFLCEQLFAASPFLLLPLICCPLLAISRLPVEWRLPFSFVRTQFVVVGGYCLVRGVISETHPNTTLLALASAVLCTAAVASRFASWFMVRRLGLLASCSAATLLIGASLIVSRYDLLEHIRPEAFNEKLARKTALSRQRLLGWSEVASRIRSDRQRYFAGEKAKFFTHSYDLASLTSFYGRGETIINLMPLALRDHVGGAAQEAYVCYDDLVGASGIYFGDETGPSPEILGEAFESVEEIAPIEIVHRGRAIKRYRVCKVQRLRPSVINSR